MSLDGGRTTPGKTGWKPYGANGIYLDVDTSGAGFADTPLYFVSIGGNSNHWALSGANAIYNASPTGFRIYLRWLDGSALTPDDANKRQWHVMWHAVSNHLMHE